MLASFEHIVPTFPLTWAITTIEVPQFESVWHFHPEFELTYIRAGQGTRLVGDSVGEYSPGNLTLIGPEVPHTYVSTPGDLMHSAVVMQFKRDFLGDAFFDIPLFAGVAALLNSSRRGVSFHIEDEAIRRLESAHPAEKTLGLVSLLLDLSHRKAEVLASDQETPALNLVSAQRIESMVRLMHTDFASNLTLSDIADAAHLTPSSASRLFSKSTGSSVTIYLNVVRVNAACRLLRDTDRSIASIAVDSGFTNLSNFNRRFRDVKKMTPREYRAGFSLGAVSA
ncbi:AraC family transcriptional regulator [Lacisediminihabitans sp. FW035]